MSGAPKKELTAEEELDEIASDIASKFHRIAKVAIEDITDEQIKQDVHLPPKDAPIYLHMTQKFVEARQKAVIDSKRGVKKIGNVYIDKAIVNLPPMAEPDKDAIVLQLEEVRENEED